MKIAILGASGAGCSSLVRVLLSKQDKDIEVVDVNKDAKEKLTAHNNMSICSVDVPKCMALNGSWHRNNKSDRKRSRKNRWS